MKEVDINGDLPSPAQQGGNTLPTTQLREMFEIEDSLAGWSRDTMFSGL